MIFPLMIQSSKDLSGLNNGSTVTCLFITCFMCIIINQAELLLSWEGYMVTKQSHFACSFLQQSISAAFQVGVIAAAQCLSTVVFHSFGFSWVSSFFQYFGQIQIGLSECLVRFLIILPDRLFYMYIKFHVN